MMSTTGLSFEEIKKTWAGDYRPFVEMTQIDLNNDSLTLTQKSNQNFYIFNNIIIELQNNDFLYQLKEKYKII